MYAEITKLIKWKYLYKSLFLFYYFRNFNIHNKKLPEVMYKHRNMWQCYKKHIIVNIHSAFVGQI